MAVNNCTGMAVSVAVLDNCNSMAVLVATEAGVEEVVVAVSYYKVEVVAVAVSYYKVEEVVVAAVIWSCCILEAAVVGEGETCMYKSYFL